MTNRCPRCQKLVASSAIACPHCRTPLKALGHEGIPLYQAVGDAVLCDTCTYHKDDSCNYPKRPLAKDCIMYVDVRIPQDPTPTQPIYSSSPWHRFTQWANQNLGLLILGGLVIISLLMVLSGG